MFNRHSAVACFSALPLLVVSVLAQNQSQISNPNRKGASVSNHATGIFEVKITPQTSDNTPDHASLGRMTIDKQFHGGLDGVSKGQMLTAGTPIKGSAGYVAIEKVTGTLDGRGGTFILQHHATMTRGVPRLDIEVVPDSGTGQLTGLTGQMTINIVDGKHSYDFEYKLPQPE
ncbi:MAG: DUF3224 domain-containing protein [Candidatus Acidiferrum sp.]